MNKLVNKNSNETLYRQVENILLELINQEPYNKGFYLPTELELSKRLKVSRHTVRKAMDSLVLNGLITREKGKGTKINLDRKKVKTTLNSWHSFTDEMYSKGDKLKHIKKFLSLEEASDEVKEVFGLNMDEKYIVPVLVRLSGSVEEVDVYFKSYFNPIFRLNEDKEFMEGKFTKLYDYLEKNYGIFTVISNEEITAEIPNKELEKVLNINEKIPVLLRKRLVYDKFGQKIEYNIGYYRADRFSYNLVLNREDY